jgi:glycosyltransferase involved in cell wall biosynthesis
MNPERTELCEIRVPTFRRPKLLKRALTSILRQSYSNWRCMVFDDCQYESARSVVEGIGDERITYVKNPTPLGAIGNIDKSFYRRPICRGKYALVLEDDNYLLPEHIERAVRISNENNVRVVFCNQFCERVDVPGEPGSMIMETTLKGMYREGIFEPYELLPSLLFAHGFSNGAAFWRTDCLSDFQIGKATSHPGIQESLRLLMLRDPVYVSLDPTAVWRSNWSPESHVNVSRFKVGVLQHIRGKVARLTEAREKLLYRKRVLQIVGLHHIYGFIGMHGREHLREIERSLLLCGFNEKLTDRGRVERLRLMLIGYAVRLSLAKKRVDSPSTIAAT